MVTCTRMEEKGFIVDLDAIELATVGMHGKRENLSIEQALADLTEYVIAQKRCEICQEEHDAVACPNEEAHTVGLELRYPKKGPLSLLNDAEKEYLMSLLMGALSRGVSILILKHSLGGN